MKFKKWEIALIAALGITLFSGFKVNGDVENLSDKLIRIHVVANSDSDEDQQLKLKVRDAVLEEISPLLENAESRDDAEQIVIDNMENLVDAARSEVAENGFEYAVNAALTEECFPTVDYDTFSLPAGKYTSLRVVIGEGEGHNWWCVVFPALCTTAILAEDNEDMLSAMEVSLITQAEPQYVIKFKIAEFIGELKNKLF